MRVPLHAAVAGALAVATAAGAPLASAATGPQLHADITFAGYPVAGGPIDLNAPGTMPFLRDVGIGGNFEVQLTGLTSADLDTPTSSTVPLRVTFTVASDAGRGTLMKETLYEAPTVTNGSVSYQFDPGLTTSWDRDPANADPSGNLNWTTPAGNEQTPTWEQTPFVKGDTGTISAEVHYGSQDQALTVSRPYRVLDADVAINATSPAGANGTVKNTLGPSIPFVVHDETRAAETCNPLTELATSASGGHPRTGDCDLVFDNPGLVDAIVNGWTFTGPDAAELKAYIRKGVEAGLSDGTAGWANNVGGGLSSAGCFVASVWTPLIPSSSCGYSAAASSTAAFGVPMTDAQIHQLPVQYNLGSSNLDVDQLPAQTVGGAVRVNADGVVTSAPVNPGMDGSPSYDFTLPLGSFVDPDAFSDTGVSMPYPVYGADSWSFAPKLGSLPAPLAELFTVSTTKYMNTLDVALTVKPGTRIGCLPASIELPYGQSFTNGDGSTVSETHTVTVHLSTDVYVGDAMIDSVTPSTFPCSPSTPPTPHTPTPHTPTPHNPSHTQQGTPPTGPDGDPAVDSSGQPKSQLDPQPPNRPTLIDAGGDGLAARVSASRAHRV